MQGEIHNRSRGDTNFNSYSSHTGQNTTRHHFHRGLELFFFFFFAICTTRRSIILLFSLHTLFLSGKLLSHTKLFPFLCQTHMRCAAKTSAEGCQKAFCWVIEAPVDDADGMLRQKRSTEKKITTLNNYWRAVDITD